MQANEKEAGGGVGIRLKLGSFFSPRGAPAAGRAKDDVEHGTFITADVLRELEEGVPTQRRVRVMRELLEIVGSKRLEEYAVQAIWRAVGDLLDHSQPADVRQAVLQFTQALVRGQFSELGVMRAHFFRVVQSHNVEEDSQQRLELLIALTHGGKDIQYFEEEIGPFLAQWMPQLSSQVSVEQLLGLLVKLVHYNSAYLEEDVLSQLVSHTCSLATQPSSPAETGLCLSFLDAVICYAVFPPETVLCSITTLCHTLNIERFIQRSLEVMQRLLGTHLGHTVIYTMCSVLQDKAHGADVLLLRGAVFFISMSLWGVKRVDTLSLPFTAVLPAIHQASLSGHTLVIYEVALSVLRLVRHYSPRLGPREWEMIFHILHATQRHLSQQAEPSSAVQLQTTLQSIFSSVEQFWEDGQNSIGPAHLFFQLLDEVRATLPVSSVLSLLLYQSQTIDAAELDWLPQISLFMEKFFKSETRLVVRRDALCFLDRILADHWLTQQDPLLQQVLLPVFTPISMDTDPDLRCQAVQLLMKYLPSASSTHTSSLLDIVSQVLLRGLGEGQDIRLPDCKAAVFGLTQLLKEAMYTPGALAGQVLSVLLQFLRQLYSSSSFTATTCVLRVNVFNCLLSLRANSSGQLGFHGDDGSTEYSPFQVCTLSGGQRSIPQSVLDLRGVFEAVTSCLEKDEEWEAVFQLLHLLRGTLQCRTLTLSAMPDLSPLPSLLASLTSSRKLGVFSNRVSVADVGTSICPLLALLATYPSHLDRRAQHDLVVCLEGGLVGKQAVKCMSALAVCSLELQPTMTRCLPRVLYRLGQVAATPIMAVPTLEFLTGLIPIPSLVSGFVEEEYLSVFGIALPYTNNVRYPPYVVSMAHHVISCWFLKCRIRYRPRVARFISKGLLAEMSEEVGGGEGELCRDLTEATLDLLARYTYSNISSLPSRSSGADFLFSHGPCKTWALGNYLVTVTTTGEAGGSPDSCPHCMSERNSGVSMATCGLCSCWSWGWAEVKVRRPSGNTAWVVRLENVVKREEGEGELGLGMGCYGEELLETYREHGKKAGEEEKAEEKEKQEGKEETILPAVSERAAVSIEPVREELEQQLPWTVSPFPMQLISDEDREEKLISDEDREETSHFPVATSPVNAVERLPPLLSYEEEGPMGRSPSLLTTSHLTEQEQLDLVARAYRSSECETDSSEDGSSQTDEAEGEKREEEESSMQENVNSLSLCKPQQTPPPVNTRSEPRLHSIPETRGGVADEELLGNDPSFVFLQLFHTAALPPHPPLLLTPDEATGRAIQLLDRIPPYATHKIGVVYVGRGQMSEAAILANTSGSSRYQRFLSGLGELLRLSSCDPHKVYLGGLDRGGNDGEFTYFYLTDTTQVVFHVASLMPTLSSDPQCSNKKLHIGNDLVTIVFNDSCAPYQFGTIKGQFGYVEVVVEPLPAGVNRVSVALCGGMDGMLSVEPVVCSSNQLPTLARTRALQANFASLVHVSESSSRAEHHPNNWLCRLRQIRHIRERCSAVSTTSTQLPDFTTYS